MIYYHFILSYRESVYAIQPKFTTTNIHKSYYQKQLQRSKLHPEEIVDKTLQWVSPDYLVFRNIQFNLKQLLYSQHI